MTARTYRSPLREEHARRTRELILDALVEVAGERSVSDLNVAELAERAGVATRTVYRHFPDRPALLEALGTHLDDRDTWHTRAGDFETLDDLVAAVPDVIAQFEARPAETRALASLNASGNSSLSKRNRRELRRVVDHSAPSLAAADVDAGAAVLHLLASSRTWARLRDEAGLDAEQTSRALCWAIATLAADLSGRTTLDERPAPSA